MSTSAVIDSHRAPDIIDLRDPLCRIITLADDDGVSVLGNEGGVVSARARVGGTACVVFATDCRVQGGALGAQGCQEIVNAYSFAIEHSVPIIGIWHSGGARLAEGAQSLHGVGTVFAAMTRASGTVPQISIVVGPAAGGAAYGPALTDVVILGPQARVFVTGPDVVNRVTGEQVDAQTLGGPAVHSRKSGLAHIEADSDDSAYEHARSLTRLLSARPNTNLLDPTGKQVDPARHVPANTRRAYDIKPLVNDLLDAPMLELHRTWAPNVVTGLGTIDGQTIGIIANNPLRMGGCLTSEASEKAARFVRFCDSFGVPLVVVVDVPGYLPGGKQESSGIIRRGAKLLHAFAAAQVPRFTVIVGKAYGGAYIAMNSRSLGAHAVIAWPRASLDVMSAEAAVAITRRRDLRELVGADHAAAAAKFAVEHEQSTGGLAKAVSCGFVDQIVEPANTRSTLIQALRSHVPSQSNEKNIPL